VEDDSPRRNEFRRPDGAPLSLAEKLGRRGFFGKMAMGALSLAGALVGLSQVVPAHAAGCCTLCSNSTSCSGRCCWSWGCCPGRGSFTNLCKECYSAASCAGDGCGNGWRCSQMVVTSVRC
jgi:hypothetical protein